MLKERMANKRPHPVDSPSLRLACVTPKCSREWDVEPWSKKQRGERLPEGHMLTRKIKTCFRPLMVVAHAK